MNSRWEDIISYLKDVGFDAYAPGRHKGDCLSPYIVVKMGPTSPYQNFSTNLHVYELLVYIPRDQISASEEILNNIETQMKALEPMIMPQHTRSSPYYDEGVKAWMVSLGYRNYTKQV